MAPERRSFVKSRFDISALAEAAKEFQNELTAVKAGAAPQDFPWYPYDSLGNFFLLDGMLTQGHRDLAELAAGMPVLDAGSADGATAFFLEQAGFEVDVIDNPPTNFNGMRGLQLLKDAFESRVNIHTVDLDAKFELPRARYGLALFLGLLYHLKNPFSALETLSNHTRYCFLSTRVAKYDPERTRVLEDLPLAYLVAPEETNNDATNFWIFSRAGLHRILSRTGWEVYDYRYVGNTENSDPASPEGDERAFLLIKSMRFTGPATDYKLLSGWLPLEPNGCRCTGDRFSVQIVSKGPQARTLALRFTVPNNQFKRCEQLSMHVEVDGREIGTQIYSTPGPKKLRIHLEQAPEAGQPLTLDCQLMADGVPASGVSVRLFGETGDPAPEPFQLI